MTIKLRSHLNRRALDYWRSRRSTRPLPSSEDLVLTDVPDLLPNIVLIKVLRQPLDFEYKMVGTEVLSHLHRDPTGQLMSTLDHQRPPSVIWSNCQQVVDSLQPLAPLTPYVGVDAHRTEIEDLVLPLSKDGVMVDELLICVEFFNTRTENIRNAGSLPNSMTTPTTSGSGGNGHTALNRPDLNSFATTDT